MLPDNLEGDVLPVAEIAGVDVSRRKSIGDSDACPACGVRLLPRDVYGMDSLATVSEQLISDARSTVGDAFRGPAGV